MPETAQRKAEKTEERRKSNSSERMNRNKENKTDVTIQNRLFASDYIWSE